MRPEYSRSPLTQIQHSAGQAPADPEELKSAVSLVGGRLSYLNKMSMSQDMVLMAKYLLDAEKAWLLSQIGPIPDCDDDVIEVCFMILFFSDQRTPTLSFAN